MGKTGTGASKATKEEIKKEEGKIVSIELLEGVNEKTDAEVIQFVNIQQNAADHVDGTTVTHIDRLGQKLRLKVKFDKPGASKFTVKLESDKKVVYNGTPIESQDCYKYSESVDFITDSNGEKIIDADKVFVSPAGGNTFTIKAIDDNKNEVTAKSKIKTKRLLYYVGPKMKNLKHSPTNVGNVFKSKFDPHDILFKEISTTAEINYSKLSIDAADEDPFRQASVNALNSDSDVSKLAPYCLGIAYTDLNAFSGNEEVIFNTSINISNLNPVVIPFRKPLWCGIDMTNWFISASFKQGTNTINIPITDCIPKKYGQYYKYIEVKLNNLPSIIDGPATIVLKAKIITTEYTGDAAGKIPFITTSQIDGTNRSDNNITRTMIHEAGHKMGLASDGTILDKTPDYYNQFTKPGFGLGNHCFKPNDCVMYGFANGFLKFCDDCAKTVKKLDLKSGIT